MRRHIYNIIKTTPRFSLDTLVSLLAPQKCYGCGISGNALCASCLPLVISPPPPRCFGCHAVSENYQTCTKCARLLTVASVRSAGPYDGIHKQLVMAMKKDASRSVAKDIAKVLYELLLEANVIYRYDAIVPVATVRGHVRERGFDHAKCIATELSNNTHIPVLELLERATSTHQVGKTRRERFAQMENGVKFISVKKLNGVKVLLVDDIATTGATLSASARVLKQAGAKTVDAVVFASGK